MLRISGLQGAGSGLVRHSQSDVLVEVDGDVLLGIRSDDPVIDELADAAARHDLIAVALENIGLFHQFAVGVVPAGLRGVVPGQQPHAPGQLQHPRCGQLDVVAAAHAQLGLATCATRPPRGDLAGGDHDDHVVQGDVYRPPVWRGRLGRHHRGRQSLDGGGSRGARCGIRALGRPCDGLLAQSHQIDALVQPPGQVRRDRSGDGPIAHVGSAQTN